MLFAFIDHNVAPMVVGEVFFMIPIVGILTRHQQKMAMILRQGRSQETDAEVASLRSELAAMRSEMRELRETVHFQVLAMDRSTQPPVAPVDVRERLRAE